MGEGSNAAQAEDGLGLVEVIIAMLLLGVIAVALLPALWQGILLSGEQSSTASATRLLNARIEEARAQKSCSAILFLDDTRIPAPTDGNGNELTVSFAGGPPACSESTTVSFTLQVADSTGTTLASVPTIIFVP